MVSWAHPIGSVVLAGLTTVTDRPTDRPTDHATRSVTVGRIYIRDTGMRPKCGSRYLFHADLGVICHPNAKLDIYCACTTFDDSNLSRPIYMTGPRKSWNGIRDHDHTPFRVGLSRLGFSMISRCTKFETSISTRYKDGRGRRKSRKWGGFG